MPSALAWPEQSNLLACAHTSNLVYWACNPALMQPSDQPRGAVFCYSAWTKWQHPAPIMRGQDSVLNRRSIASDRVASA